MRDRFKCASCGHKLQVGDAYFSRKGASRKYTQFRCKNCYENVVIKKSAFQSQRIKESWPRATGNDGADPELISRQEAERLAEKKIIEFLKDLPLELQDAYVNYLR